MEFLIPIGSIVALAGLVGLLWCILLVAKAKRAGLPDDQMKARLQKVIALNMAALGVSAIGLMLVVIGVLL